MIANYWFPSIIVFPTNPYNIPGYSSVSAPASDENIVVRVVGRSIVVDGCRGFQVYSLDGKMCGAANLQSGVYVVRTDNGTTRKVIVN